MVCQMVTSVMEECVAGRERVVLEEVAQVCQIQWSGKISVNGNLTFRHSEIGKGTAPSG